MDGEGPPSSLLPPCCFGCRGAALCAGLHMRPQRPALPGSTHPQPASPALPPNLPCLCASFQCPEKPADDPYSFTHFAHELNACGGGINPLPSDSRRRPDRALLEQGNSSGGRRVGCKGRAACAAGLGWAAMLGLLRVARRMPSTQHVLWRPQPGVGACPAAVLSCFNRLLPYADSAVAKYNLEEMQRAERKVGWFKFAY